MVPGIETQVTVIANTHKMETWLHIFFFLYHTITKSSIKVLDREFNQQQVLNKYPITFRI